VVGSGSHRGGVGGVVRPWLGPTVRGYRALWLASLVSVVGTWLSVIGLQLEVYGRTHSTLWAAVIFIADYLPPVIVGVLFANRLSRAAPRRTMIVANLASAASCAALVWIRNPAAIFACALLSALAAATIVPIATAVVPRLVDDDQLEGANAALAAVDSASTLIGESLGGLAYALVGAGVFMLNAASFVLSALLLARLPSLPRPQVEARTPWGQLRHAAAVFRRRPPGSSFVLLWPVVSFPLGAVLAVTIPLVLSRGGNSAESGFALAAVAVGIVAAAPLAGHVNTRSRQAAPMVALGLMGASLFAAGLVPLAGIFVCSFVTGAGNVIALVALRTRVQRMVEPSEIAGIAALVIALSCACLSLGALVGGAIADVRSPSATFIYAGGLLLVVGAASGRSELPGTAAASGSDAGAGPAAGSAG
jgi:predicted MFS family arabinose efflux permease